MLAGGISTPEHAVEASKVADAIAIGAGLHYGRTTIKDIKRALADSGKEIRECG